MVTSPAAVKEWGRAEVMAVSETEKRSDPVSSTTNKLPVVDPLVPMFMENRSALEVVEAGFHSNMARCPPEVRAVEVELIYNPSPVDKPLAVIFSKLAVAMELAATSIKFSVARTPDQSMSNRPPRVPVPSRSKVATVPVVFWSFTRMAEAVLADD